MSCYWKQSLWIGGIYWIISQIFTLSGSLIGNTVDAGLSLLLVLFLIPMNWLKPIKKIDEAINKSPIISTLLVSVGWVPYVIGVVYAVSVAASVWIMMSGDGYEYRLFNLFQTIIVVTNLRQLIMILTVLSAIFMILVGKRTIAGKLDKHFKLMKAEEKAGVMAEETAKPKKKVEKTETVSVVVKPDADKKVKASVKKTASKPKTKKTTKPVAKAKKETVKKAPAKAKTKA